MERDGERETASVCVCMSELTETKTSRDKSHAACVKLCEKQGDRVKRRLNKIEWIGYIMLKSVIKVGRWSLIVWLAIQHSAKVLSEFNIVSFASAPRRTNIELEWASLNVIQFDLIWLNLVKSVCLRTSSTLTYCSQCHISYKVIPLLHTTFCTLSFLLGPK